MEHNLLLVNQSERGNTHSFGDGYFFTVNVKTSCAIYLRCVKYRDGCIAKVYVDLLQGSCLLANIQHNHDPDFLKALEYSKRQSVLNECANLLHATLPEVFASFSHNLYLNKRSLWPSMIRARLQALPDPPRTLQDLSQILTDPRYKCLSATTGFQDSIYDWSTVVADGCAVILLMSGECKDFLQYCTCLVGMTTQMTIEGATEEIQVHVLATVWDNIILIVGWVIVERPTQQAYHAAFSQIKANLEDCQLTLILCEEDSLEESVYRNLFPSVQVNSSLYTFTQSLCRKISARTNLTYQQLQGSQSIYLIGLCSALPMIPSNFITEAVRIIKRDIQIMNNHQDFSFLMEVVNALELKYISDPHGAVTFSACGNFLRSSNVSEIIHTSSNLHISTQNNFYSLIRYLTTTAEKTSRHIQKIQDGLTVRGSATTALSEDAEIDLLTRSLTETFLSSSDAVLNLLKNVSTKQQHLLAKFLR